MPDATLYAQLTTHAGLTALIAGRVYAGVAAESPTYPLCVYSRVSDVPTLNQDGTIAWRDMRYQVSCYATRRDSVLAVAEQVIDALHTFEGSPATLYCRFENLTEMVEPNANGVGQHLYHAAVDFIVTEL